MDEERKKRTEGKVKSFTETDIILVKTPVGPAAL